MSDIAISILNKSETYLTETAVAINVFGNLFFDGLEKTLQFSWDFTDGNHTASLLISYCIHNSYRQKKLFLFDNHCYQNPP